MNNDMTPLEFRGLRSLVHHMAKILRAHGHGREIPNGFACHICRQSAQGKAEEHLGSCDGETVLQEAEQWLGEYETWLDDL